MVLLSTENRATAWVRVGKGVGCAGGRGSRLEHIEILYTPFQFDLVRRQLGWLYRRKDSFEVGSLRKHVLTGLVHVHLQLCGGSRAVVEW